MPIDPNQDTGVAQWVINSVVGLVSGMLSAVASVAWFGGDVRATLKAHDLRLKTLEDDIRYEIRAIRQDINSLRQEVANLVIKH